MRRNHFYTGLRQLTIQPVGVVSHDPGALAPLGFAHARTPLFAEAKLPSMKASSGSNPPRLRRSLASVSSTPRMTPCWKPPVGGLVRKIPLGQISPRCTGAQDEEDAVENFTPSAPAAPATVFTSWWFRNQ
jgi:hypothetical protein